MTRVNGQLIICDRCGEKVFIKCIGEGETDGGYTRWNKFEQLSKEWKYKENHMLCPKCSKEFDDLMKIFFDYEVQDETNGN